MAKFLKKAIKHPGRVKNAAKREGISTHAEAVKMSHSSNRSARGAGQLALRFQKGGDLHGGSKKLSADSMKGTALMGRNDNIKHKAGFKSGPMAEK